MTRLLTILLPLTLLLACASAAAEKIYRTTDEDGNVVFTDDPPEDGAEPVELEPLTTVPPVEADASDDGRQAGQEAAEEPDEPPDNGITGIAITYPEDDKGVRHNGGNVPFRVALEPEGASLPRGHQVEIVLDGQPRGRAAGTEVTVSPVDRGPHTARARVLDASGASRYESPPIKFYLLRASVGGE